MVFTYIIEEFKRRHMPLLDEPCVCNAIKIDEEKFV